MGLFYWLSGFACAQGLFGIVMEIYRPQPTTNFWWMGFVGCISFLLVTRCGRREIASEK